MVMDRETAVALLESLGGEGVMGDAAALSGGVARQR